MSRVTVETVAHVARLARLSLTAEEQETYARQLDQVLAYAESIQALETAAAPPMSHAIATGAFREDAARGAGVRTSALEQAPDAADGLFRVPRILP